MSHRSKVSVLASLSVVAAFVGCSASGSSNVDLSETTAGTEPGATLPPPSHGPGSGTPVTDAGKPGKPPAGDASVDSGPPPPAPGATCATADQIFSRACGACGT